MAVCGVIYYLLLNQLNAWKVIEVVLAEQPLLRTPLAYAKLTSAALVVDKSQQKYKLNEMESYRSGHNERDSKSCCPIGHGGSNPPLSANGRRRRIWSQNKQFT